MAEEQSLVVKILADVTDFEKKMQSMSKNLSAMSSNFSKASTPFLVGGGAIAGVLGLFVKNAGEAETASAMLSTALKTTKQYSDETKQSMLDLATKIQNYSGISDEALQDAMRFGLQLGRTKDEVMALLPKIVDFSAATKVDLQTAMKLANNALTGNIGALTRYGIQIEKSEEGTVSFNSVLDAFSGFAGSAATQGDTFQGKLKIVKEQIGDLTEILGAGLLPVIKNFIDNHIMPLIKRLGEIPTEKLTKDIQILAGVAGFLLLIGAIGKTISMISNFAALLMNPTSGIIFAISMLVIGIVALVKHWDKVKAAFKGFYERHIKPWMDPLISGLKKVIEFFEKIVGFFKSVGSKIKETFTTPEVGEAFANYAGGFASGGSFVVSRPTLFTAGEKGTERVTVTPQNKSEDTTVFREMLKELRKFNEITAPELGRKISLSVSGLGGKI